MGIGRQKAELEKAARDFTVTGEPAPLYSAAVDFAQKKKESKAASKKWKERKRARENGL